jgi:hypothetical protein
MLEVLATLVLLPIAAVSVFSFIVFSVALGKAIVKH